MQKFDYSFFSKGEEYLEEIEGGRFCLSGEITIFHSQRHMHKVYFSLYITKIILQHLDFIIYIVP